MFYCYILYAFIAIFTISFNLNLEFKTIMKFIELSAIIKLRSFKLKGFNFNPLNILKKGGKIFKFTKRKLNYFFCINLKRL